MNIRRYQDYKYQLADVLRAVPWRSEHALRNRELFERLSEDRFNLAVVGRYSRGKSTLMNAMMGTDRLPMGREPLTSVITSVVYGSVAQAVLRFAGTSLIEDIPLSRLTDYITERGNPGNVRRVSEAEIQLPAEILRQGFRFVDTPGLGSRIRANTQTTQAFLEQIDAFILVSGFDGTVTADEKALLSEIHRSGRPLFAVLNKADLVHRIDHDLIIRQFRTAITDAGFDPQTPIFALTAREALLARLRRDNAALEVSGVVPLERSLTDFLLRDRQSVFLRSMCDRIGAALDAEFGDGIDEAQGRLMSLRACIAHDQDDETGLPIGHPTLPDDLPRCAACEYVERGVFHYLTTLQHNLRIHASTRDSFLSAGGLCPNHARAFGDLAAPREVCTAFGPLLLQKAQRLRQRAEEQVSHSGDSVSPVERATCPACDVAARRTAGFLSKFAADLEDGRAEFEDHAGLCEPHFEALLSRVPDISLHDKLLHFQAAVLERRGDDMLRFALRQDACRRDVMTVSEKNAAQRGLETAVGRPNAVHDHAAAPAANRSEKEKVS